MFQETPKIEEFNFGADAKMDFVESQKALSEYSNRVLQVFTQTRERVFEIQTTITNTIPGITRLGGSIIDVSKIIGEVAEASRRNVLASKEDVEGLFTLTQILGGTATELANAFLDVGRGIEKIPKELGESIEYIQNIGGNAKSIMADVTKNMGVMNRFQFNEGVLGLTKMAAQASMLRFDMNKTFEFAENLYKPEEAIRVAAAFQRMGVAIGSLGDPLQLMNQSINDPSGLQDSLVEVSKQFTYLDKQTNTFKISRQGVLILKELGEEARIDANELMKMGLAAAELDQRLSAVGDAGLNIKEEDKQYLANIAKMGEKSGEYEVKIRNEQGEEQTRLLSKITQDEFEKLIKEQKEGPKGLEETAKAALRLDQIVSNDVKAIKNTIVGGTLTAPTLQNINEDIRTVMKETFNSIVNLPNLRIDGDKGVRTRVESTLDKIESNLLGAARNFDYDKPGSIFENLLKGVDLEQFSTELQSELTKSIENISTTLTDKFNETNLRQRISPTVRRFNTDGTSQNEPVTTTGLSVGGTQGASSNPIFSQSTQPRNANVNVGGEVNVNVKIPTLPVNFTPAETAQAKQMIQEAFETQFFIDHIRRIVNKEEPIKIQ